MGTTISITGAQIIGFLVLMFMVGPAIFYLGRLTQRVIHLENHLKEDRDAATEHREAIWDAIEGMRNKVDDVWRHVRGVHFPSDPTP